MPIALTSLSHGAGCGCKLPAAQLHPVVRGLPASADPRVLVGPQTADDAGVYRLRDDVALIQTVDFFTPIVDDPYDFGRIAATNALSDVYAMGGEPVTALNLVAFPLEQLGGDVLAQILRGGQDVADSAGVAIVGGHSIDDSEPKYGLSVTGTAHPDQIVTNATARSGDLLVLTKPLGAGAVATAVKRGLADVELLASAVAVMVELNRDAAVAARAAGVHAMTDVTGFGLLGHLHEMGAASGLAAEVDASAVPAIDGVLELLAGEEAVSGGALANARYAQEFADFATDVGSARRRLVTDPMTSGGLLVALEGDRAGELPGAIVGRMVDGARGTITVRG